MTEAAFLTISPLLEQRARQLGFQQLAITNAEPGVHGKHLQNWLENNYHGEMQWMQDRANLRLQPDALHKGTLRVITVRMDYLQDANSEHILSQPDKAYISRYALGRDYHKLMRKKLAQLADYLSALIQESETLKHFGQADSRPFVDSAPVLERGFAEKAGLGWIGKNTMLIHPQAGSWFFLGEIYTNQPLALSSIENNLANKHIPTGNHCGSCRNCLVTCPTGAFVAANKLDARKCISYLTIELEGSIPEDLRPLMGNRVFGCDDCQLACPFNKFAQHTSEPDFSPRHQLENSTLLDLFLWNKETFLEKTAGSPIRRIGYQRWLRNLAVGLGNAPGSPAIKSALEDKLAEADELVKEHILWALEQQNGKTGQKT